MTNPTNPEPAAPEGQDGLVAELEALSPQLPEYGFDTFYSVPADLFDRILARLQAAPASLSADAGEVEPSSGDYLICKGGAYYRPNAEGYTRNPAEAGRYTLDEAISHSHPNGPNGPRDVITYVHESAVPRAAMPGQTRADGLEEAFDCALEKSGRKIGDGGLVYSHAQVMRAFRSALIPTPPTESADTSKGEDNNGLA